MALATDTQVCELAESARSLVRVNRHTIADIGLRRFIRCTIQNPNNYAHDTRVDMLLPQPQLTNGHAPSLSAVRNRSLPY